MQQAERKNVWVRRSKLEKNLGRVALQTKNYWSNYISFWDLVSVVYIYINMC